MATTADPTATATSARGIPPPDATRLWYLLAVSGGISLVIGILVLVYPDTSLKLLGVFLGIELLLGGGIAIVRGLWGGGEADAAAAYLLLGSAGLIGGVVVIRNPGETLTVLVLVFAIYLIVAGALSMGRAIAGTQARLLSLARSVLMIAAGTLIVSWPDLSLKTLTVLAGIALVIQGIVEIVEGFVLRSSRRASEAVSGR